MLVSREGLHRGGGYSRGLCAEFYGNFDNFIHTFL